MRATFLYGTRAHVPDAMVMTDGSVYRLITDHVGSVRLVVNAETGEVVQRIDYDAFGRVLHDTNPGFQPFGFAGGLYDDDTGLVRFGARNYDAYAGRWTAKDPILFAGSLTNLYSYAGGDPINFIDPTDLMCSYWDRLWRNFKETNQAIPGLLAPIGVGLFTGGAFAEAVGLPSFGGLAAGAASGAAAIGEAAEGAGLGFGAAGGTAAIPGAALAAAGNFALTGLVFEAGVFVGSAAAAAPRLPESDGANANGGLI